jgi:hypothetical protein
VALPPQFQGEAITWAPGDEALLVASERQAELWWVPLAQASPSSPPSASATPSGSVSTAVSTPTATSVSPPVTEGGAGSSSWPVGAVLAAAALVGGAGVLVVLRRDRG